MTPRNLLVLLVLVAFSGYTALVVAETGYVGFFRNLFSNPVGIQVFIDLSIALGLILGWMRCDARRNELPFLPYLAATLLLGSIGTLAYLLHRGLGRRAERASNAPV
ncbi:DUF2834 domain-containing protein [Myxococcota bacterium]|nr:DUF2834 domain-containing protein [Myxococcota bacterium]